MVLVFSEDSGGKYNQKNLSNKKNLLFFDKFTVTASSRGAAGEPVADVAAELLAGRWRILRRFVSQHSRRSAKVPGRTLCRACRRVGADVVSSLSEGRGRLRRGCLFRIAAGLPEHPGGCCVGHSPVAAASVVVRVSPFCGFSGRGCEKSAPTCGRTRFLPIFAHIWQ